MQTNQFVTGQPAHVGLFAAQEVADSRLLNANFVSNRALRHADFNKIKDEVFPVHASIISKPIGKAIGNHRITEGALRILAPMDTFGDRLKIARKETGLSQAAAAKRVGMSQPNLSELEAGRYPTSGLTAALASLYGVNALWLAEGKGPRHPGGGAHAVQEQAALVAPPLATVAQIMAALEPLLALARVPVDVIAYPTRADLEARLQAALDGKPAPQPRNWLDEPDPAADALIKYGELLPELPSFADQDDAARADAYIASLNPATGTGSK